MLSNQEVEQFITELESDRVERTISVNNFDKFSEAVCAFSNDFPNYKKPGYLFIGVQDNGVLSGLKATDELLKNLSAIRNSGNILPQPAMTVQKYEFPTGDVIAVEVFPADLPPVRYKGRVWIRVGPTRAIASEAEEKILSEKRFNDIILRFSNILNLLTLWKSYFYFECQFVATI